LVFASLSLFKRDLAMQPQFALVSLSYLASAKPTLALASFSQASAYHNHSQQA
jgi:hypothetical protein